MPSSSLHRTRAAAALAGLGIAAAASVAVAVPAASAQTAAPAVTVSRFDHRLLADINRARHNHGLRALTLAAGTTDVAHGWACRLADARTLVHNPRLGGQLNTHGSRRWTTYAENIGYVHVGSGAGTLFRTYMHSPEHRANILDPTMRYVGLWTKSHAHRRWNTIDFVGSHLDSYRFSYGSERRSC